MMCTIDSCLYMFAVLGTAQLDNGSKLPTSPGESLVVHLHIPLAINNPHFAIA